MFFASKLGWLVFQPLCLAFLLVLAGLALIALDRRRLALAANGLASLILFLTLGTTMGTVLLQRLEGRIPPTPIKEAPACLLVLGGSFEGDVTRTRGGVELNQSAERYVELLHLARLYPKARIIVSGGDGSLTGGYEDDITVMRRLADQFDLPQTRLIPEPLSRNTYENAVNSRLIMQREGFGSCVMITSAFHMPRALGMMRKAGAAVQPWPVDYRTDGVTGFKIDFTEPSENVQKTTTAIREYAGLLANYLVGRTDSLFPAP